MNSISHQYIEGETLVYLHILDCTFFGDVRLYGFSLSYVQIAFNFFSMHFIGKHALNESILIIIIMLMINIKCVTNKGEDAIKQKQTYLMLVNSIEDILVRVNLDKKIVFMNRDFGGIQNMIGKLISETPISNEECIKEVIEKGRSSSWAIKLNDRVYMAKADLYLGRRAGAPVLRPQRATSALKSTNQK